MEIGKLTQKEAAKCLGVPRRTFRNWLDERNCIPECAFNKIINSKPVLLDFARYIEKKLDPNWGQQLGGKETIKLILEKYGSAEILRRQKKGGKKNAESRLRKIQDRMPTTTNINALEALGALIGDGWIGRYGRRKQVAVCGNLKKELQYGKHLSRIFAKTFGIKPYLVERKEVNTFYLIMQNSVLFDYFNREFDFPIGKKERFNTKKFPNIWRLQIPVIRGLFDTDGSIYFDKSIAYRNPYPIIEIASKNKELKNWIMTALEKNGFRPIMHLRGVRLKGLKSTNRWFKEITPHNKAKVRKYKTWRKLYCAGP